MALQYNRVYELQIDNRKGTLRVVKDLRVSFEITKSLISMPNLARIEIYNPNSDTLAALQDKFAKITFNAGYSGDVRLLFKGNIRNVFQERRAQDRIVTIYAGDGEKDWQNGLFNKTLSQNVNIKTVVKDVIKSFKEAAEGELLGLDKVADKLRGQTLSGSSKDILDKLAEDYGFQWSIQDGDVVTVPNEQALRPDDAILVTASTGMIGTPTVTEIGADAKTLLNPKAQPNRAFKIESLGSTVQLGNLFFRDVRKTSAEGFYKIQEVVHRGDTHSNEWSSSLKGITLNV